MMSSPLSGVTALPSLSGEPCVNASLILRDASITTSVDVGSQCCDSSSSISCPHCPMLMPR